MTSKKRNHIFTNSKCWIKAREAIKTPFNGSILFLIYYFKKHFKPCFSILKAFKDISKHLKFVNWWIRGFVFFMSRIDYSMGLWFWVQLIYNFLYPKTLCTYFSTYLYFDISEKNVRDPQVPLSHFLFFQRPPYPPERCFAWSSNTPPYKREINFTMGHTMSNGGTGYPT